MTPLILYPQKRRLAAAMIGGFLLCYLALDAARAGVLATAEALSTGVLLLCGGGIVALAGWRLLTGTPVFAADRDGFVVLGSERLDWTAFRGVEARGVSYVLTPLAAHVTLRVAGAEATAPSRKICIPALYLSGSAPAMARRIELYAEAATSRNVGRPRFPATGPGIASSAAALANPAARAAFAPLAPAVSEEIPVAAGRRRGRSRRNR